MVRLDAPLGDGSRPIPSGIGVALGFPQECYQEVLTYPDNIDNTNNNLYSSRT